jgi:hypothetical protein
MHLLTYVVVVGIMVAINALIGGRWWSFWIAAAWGGFLVLRFVVAAIIWRTLGRRWSGARGWRGRP